MLLVPSGTSAPIAPARRKSVALSGLCRRAVPLSANRGVVPFQPPVRSTPRSTGGQTMQHQVRARGASQALTLAFALLELRGREGRS